MAFTVHPVGSASGFSEESQLDSDLHRLLHAFGGRLSDFVVDPFAGGDFDVTTSGSNYDVDVAAGDAFFGGHFVRSDATVTVTVDPSTTNELFLVVDDAETNNAAVTFTSDGSTPTGQYVMKIWEATTDGSGVTGTTDFREYVPFRDGNSVADSITGRKSGTSGTIDASSTGTKTVSVSFAQPYQNAVDDVQLTLNELSDTAVTFGFIRPINVTTSGFDIQVNLDNAGGTGATADFNWTAYGK